MGTVEIGGCKVKIVEHSRMPKNKAVLVPLNVDTGELDFSNAVLFVFPEGDGE